AAVVEGDQRAAMGAAILEAVDRPVGIAHHEYRSVAALVAAIVALVGDGGLEADEVPGRALEQPRHLALVVGLVLVDPVGDARERVLGPHRRRLFLVTDVHREPPYSKVTLADLITPRQRISSSLMNSAVPAGVLPTGS